MMNSPPIEGVVHGSAYSVQGNSAKPRPSGFMATLRKKKPPPEIEVRRLPDVTLNCWGSEALKSPEKFKKLWDYILLSKTDEKAVIAATNAMSALCAVGYSFSKQDLSGINIPGANLSCGIFYETNFTAANLKGVNFQQAVLNGAILANANVTGADFGQVNFRLRKEGSPCSLAIHGKMVAIGEERDAYLRENAQIHLGVVRFDQNRPVVKIKKSWSHRHTVRGLTFSADGKTLLSTGGDGVCKLWDAQTGNQRHNLLTNFVLKRNVLDKFPPNTIQELENTGTLKLVPSYPDYYEVNIEWENFDYETKNDIADFFWNKIFAVSSAISNRGDLIVSVNKAGDIYIWDLKTLELVRFIADLDSYGIKNSGNILFADSGNQLIVPTKKSILVLDWKTQKVIESYSSEQNGGYHRILLSQDNSQMAALGLGATIWSSGEPLPKKDFNMFNGTITSIPGSIAFSSGGELVAIGSEKEIRIWNTKNWSPTCYFGGLSFRTTALGFIEDRHLVVLSECDTPKIYTVATSQLNQTSPNVGYIKAVSFTNDGKRVLCLTPYGVSCWDNTSGRLKFQLPKVDEPTLFFAKEMVVSKCQRYLLTRQENEAVLWDLETKETIRSILRDEIKGVGFLSSGRVAIIGSNSLETYDIEKEKFFYCLANRVSSLSVYSFSEDGRWLAFANTDGTVIAYNCEGGQTYTLRNLHAASPVKSIKICNDTIISQSKICHIWRPLENWMRSYDHFDEAWTTKSAPNLILFRIGQTLGSYTANENTVSLRHRMEPMLSFLDISPTDTVLRADFGQVRLWSEETGRFQAGFKDAFHYSCLAMHPSLPIAAVGGQEGMIRIWNFETGKCLSFLKGHRTGVTHLLFSGDGSNLLSAANDNTMQSWDLKDIDRAYLQWRTPPYSLFLDSLNTHDVQCDISVENLLFDENAKTDKMLAMEWLLKREKNYIYRPHVFPPDETNYYCHIDHKEYNLEQSIIIINDKILAKNDDKDFIDTLVSHLPLLIELSPKSFEYILQAIQSVASNIQTKKDISPVELFLLDRIKDSPYSHMPHLVRELLDIKLRKVIARLLNRTLSRPLDSKTHEQVGDILVRENNNPLALISYCFSTQANPNNKDASEKQEALMQKLNIKL